MRVAIVAESFLPHVSGVTGSILQVLRHLEQQGHEALVIAPTPEEPLTAVDTSLLHGARVEWVPSVALPAYPDVRVALAAKVRLAQLFAQFRPDVVHLASPFLLGWAAVRAADELCIPSVAVYQTDVTAYAERYGLAAAGAFGRARISRLHRRATLNLVPSTSAASFLAELEVDRMHRWGRGVDLERFRPSARDESWREAIAAGKTIVGYVGRLSPEKQVEDLVALRDLDDVQLVIVGDGPSRAELERLLPEAHFTGALTGDALARAFASFDLFVQPGESETFCQTIQEAMASGTPVMATGAGGPLDLVTNGVNGWLYESGNLIDLRARVIDLARDAGQRRAFAVAARASVADRDWDGVCRELLAHYDQARELRAIDNASTYRPRIRRERARAHLGARPQIRRMVALGDSLTEGLGDTSRVPEGEYLGWVARLALLLAERDGIEFANLAVRSRRMEHLPQQVDSALALAPELVTVMIGANDLVRFRVDVSAMLEQLEAQVARLREGSEVLLGTLFLPARRVVRPFASRFVQFNEGVREIGERHGCFVLDADDLVALRALENWCEDKVHPNSAGHRVLAYRAAEILGVPNAAVLHDLELALHTSERGAAQAELSWLRAHALPWAWRRIRRRTAGDGRVAKHSGYVRLSAE